MFRAADREEWPSFEGFQGMSNWEETRGRTGWWDYISRLTWERLRIPQEELEIAAGERDFWNILLGC